MKRLIDLLIAVPAMVVLSPLFLMVACVVKASSPGPVFFRQERVGRGFRAFLIYKFRTMVADAPRLGAAITCGDDPRITAVGRWLRKTKLDELPQLINVLKGDMSLVGPRPEVPRYVAMFRADYEEILKVRPGITDPASILYRDESAVLGQAGDPEQEYVRRILPEKIAMAKRYVREQSLATDAAVIFRTLVKLVADRIRPLVVGWVSRPVLDGSGEPSYVIPGKEQPMNVPFFRVSMGDAEIDEVVACLRSGWLTTGERVRRFEAELADFVGARHAVALNSCTAALHLAVEALGLGAGHAVLVPTMTFAATAEVVRYQGAVPLLVDCDPVTLNLDLDDAERKISDLKQGRTPLDPSLKVVGIMPVHYGGLMVDMDEVRALAARHGLWVVEDAAHALPAAYRCGPSKPWRRCGENTAAVTCFSFYANKTITTGEGGMAVTDNAALADRIRQMSLHGLSHDAWKRYSGGSWDYRIVAPGYKYNLTDVAAAIGIHQLHRAEAMRRSREQWVLRYRESLGDLETVEMPPVPENRLHSWHLFPIRLRLEQLAIDRNAFFDELRARGVCCSVHWRPLHRHPYYAETFGWQPEHLPVASAVWKRLVSLPLFPDMRDEELQHVVKVVREVCAGHRLPAATTTPRLALHSLRPPLEIAKELGQRTEFHLAQM